MQSLMTLPGFLGTSALLYADITFILILTSAALLTIGWRLAVGKHYVAHRWVQTSAVIVNTIAVFSVMIPSFIRLILPGIPGQLLEGTYGVTTVHALIGLFGLVLGIFVVLRANGLMPKPLQFKNYKFFMRTSYALYMLATFIGVIVYIWRYVLE